MPRSSYALHAPSGRLCLVIALFALCAFSPALSLADGITTAVTPKIAAPTGPLDPTQFCEQLERAWAGELDRHELLRLQNSRQAVAGKTTCASPRPDDLAELWTKVYSNEVCAHKPPLPKNDQAARSAQMIAETALLEEFNKMLSATLSPVLIDRSKAGCQVGSAVETDQELQVAARVAAGLTLRLTPLAPSYEVDQEAAGGDKRATPAQVSQISGPPAETPLAIQSAAGAPPVSAAETQAGIAPLHHP